jgi:acetamidase/formamidase
MFGMRLSSQHRHTVWDGSIEPVMRIAPGEIVEIEVANSSGGQLGADSTAADLLGLDFSRVNPVTGPIAVDGAEPGDSLVIQVLDIAVADWGWTANIPGFGLLAEQFPDPHLRFSAVSGGAVHFLDGITLPALPMIGTIGLAPPGGAVLPMVPPHRQGGNMDIRQVTAGCRLRLPVAVAGGLLSLGDTHAAMGDGEVCGTGIEISSVVTVRVDLAKDQPVPAAVLETDGRAARSGPALVATGIGPDIWQAARDATGSLIEQLVQRTGLAPVDAYLLASVTADMHIAEIVDLPNVVVAMHFPLDVLGS